MAENPSKAGGIPIPDIKDAFAIVDRLVRNVAVSREQFLDRAQKEWAIRERRRTRRKAHGASPGDEGAAARMQLLRDARAIVSGNVRRDAVLPRPDFNDAMDLLDQLEAARRELKLTPEPHPTIIRIRADLSYQIKDYGRAIAYLDDAIQAREAFYDELQTRDLLDFRFLRVRGLFCLGRYDEAVSEADSVLLAARKLDRASESRAMRVAVVPKLWMPMVVQATFACCDARLHHCEWGKSQTLSEEFTYRWNEAIRYNAPRAWLAPLKIAAISDEFWCARAVDYIELIARDLYIELPENPLESMLRCIRCSWAGFGIKPRTLARPALALLMLLLLTAPSHGSRITVGSAFFAISRPHVEFVLDSREAADFALAFMGRNLAEYVDQPLSDAAKVVYDPFTSDITHVKPMPGLSHLMCNNSSTGM